MIPVLFGLKVLKNFKRDFMCMFACLCMCDYCIMYGGQKRLSDSLGLGSCELACRNWESNLVLLQK